MNQDELLASRYGRTKKAAKRDRIFAIVVAAAALVGFLIWGISTTAMNANDVTSEVRGFTVISNEQTEVKFSITRPKQASVLCQVEILDATFAIVGYREALVLSNAPTEQTVLVNTTGRGTTGVVKACWFK
jgi:hypothetical protein